MLAFQAGEVGSIPITRSNKIPPSWVVFYLQGESTIEITLFFRPLVAFPVKPV